MRGFTDRGLMDPGASDGAGDHYHHQFLSYQQQHSAQSWIFCHFSPKSDTSNAVVVAAVFCIIVQLLSQQSHSIYKQISVSSVTDRGLMDPGAPDDAGDHYHH